MNDMQETTNTTSTAIPPSQRWMRQATPPLFDATTLGLRAERAALLAKLCARAWPLLLDCIDQHWAVEYERMGFGIAITFRGAGGCEVILMPETDIDYPRAVAGNTDPATLDWYEWESDTNVFGAWDDGIAEEVVRRLDLPDPRDYDPDDFDPDLTDPDDMPEDVVSEDEMELLRCHVQHILDTCFDLKALHADALQRMLDAADPQVLDMWRCIAARCDFDPTSLRLDDYTLLQRTRDWMTRLHELAPDLLWLGWLVGWNLQFEGDAQQPVKWLRQQVMDIGASRDDWRRLVRVPTSAMAGMYNRSRDTILPEILSIVRASRLCGIDLVPETPQAYWALGFQIPEDPHAMVTCRGYALPRGLAAVVMREGIVRVQDGRLEVFEEHELSLLMAWLNACGVEAADPNQIRAGWPALWRQVKNWLASRADDRMWSFAVGACSHQGWTILPITGSRALRLEGHAMRHCAADYTSRCENGRLRFFRATRQADGARMILSLEHQGGQWSMHEFKGRANADPDAEALDWADGFAAWYSDIAGHQSGVTVEATPDGESCPVCGGSADCERHFIVSVSAISGHTAGPAAARLERLARGLEARIINVARGFRQDTEDSPFVTTLARELRAFGSLFQPESRAQYARWINLSGRTRSCINGYLEHMDGVHSRAVEDPAEDGVVTRKNWLYAAQPERILKALAAFAGR